MARLGDVATYINGYAFKPADWSDIGLPIIRIQDLTGNAYQANRYSGSYDSKYEVVDGDVLISWSASLGVYVWHGETALLNQHIFRVVFDKCDVDKHFFIHQVRAILEKAGSATHGATMKHLTKPVFDSLPFFLPSMEKQKEIAERLDVVSTLIEYHKQQLAKLDELVKFLFIELFGDDVPTVKLGEVCRMINGDRGKNYPSGDDFVEDGVPFVNAGHLQNRTVNFDDMNYITETKYDLLSQGKMQVGDILYCLRGSLGKHGLVDFEKGAVASSLVILRCNQEKLLPKFLLYALETPEIELQLKTANNGSSQPNLSAASVKAYDIKVPTIEQQRQFVAFVEQTDKLKLAIQESLAKLETLKKSLMQQYFG